MQKRHLVLTIFVFLVFQFNVFAQKSETEIWYVEGYSEKIAKKYFSRSNLLEPVEGIWQSTDGFKYSIERDVENGKRLSGKYRVIILESSHDGWVLGQIKGFITTASVENLYSFKYYTRFVDGSNVESQNVFLVLESPIILTFQRISDSKKISMYRLFPKIEETESTKSDTSERKVVGWGSGFAIGEKYIVTNHHVADGSYYYSIYGINGDMSKSYNAKVILVDKKVDLALLKIDDDDFPGFGTIPYGFNYSTVDVGTEVFAMGYPRIQHMGTEVKVTNGIINAKSGYQGDISLYQMSATIQHGNSGGPVFDYAGNLVGVSVASYGASVDENGELLAENVKYAIKSSYLKALIESCSETIDFPSNSISSLSLPEKIKTISPFVFLIEASSGRNESKSNKPQQSSRSVNRKKDAAILASRAYEKYQNGDYQGAFYDVDESVNLYPTPEAHYLRGFLAISIEKDTNKSIESYNYCINNDYKLEDSYLGLAECYGMQGKFSDAVELFGKALYENVKNVRALYGRAWCKSQLGEHFSSITDYLHAIKYEGVVDFDYGTIYNNIAHSYTVLGDYLKAEKNIKEALKRNHMTYYIWGTDGELAYKKGEYERCIQSMGCAITLNNKDANAYYYRGLSRTKIGDYSGAYGDMELLRILDSKKADTLKSFIDISKVDLDKLNDNGRIVSHPYVFNKSPYFINLESVEVSPEYTALHISIVSPVSPARYYCVDKDAYIVDRSSRQKLYLIQVKDCSIYPKFEKILHGRAEFVLYFPSLSEKCRKIDFYETNSKGEVDNWILSGINIKPVL